jgi:predicted transcriptional regulator
MEAVRNVMTRRVHAVTPETRVLEANELASRHDVSHLPVMRGDRLVGLVCACDLDAAPLGAVVSLFMHSPVKTIQADAPLSAAVQLMQQDAIGSLMVLSGEAVVGILTRRDLARRSDFDDSTLPRCAACGAREHLSPAVSGEPVWCADCTERRSSRPDQLDLGNGG